MFQTTSQRDRLLEILATEEGHEVEFKKAERNLPSSMWESVSAFANTRGGRVILGVDESRDPPEVCGVANASRQLDHLFSSLRNPQKISRPVCGVGDVEIFEIDGKDVISITVQEAPRRMKPVYINGNPYHGTFLRGHTGDYIATKPEVDRMMREAADDSVDSTILPGYSIDDLSQATIARYRRRFQTQNIDSPRNELDETEFLYAIGAFRRDRERGESGLTLAGLLMFGLDEAIRDRRPGHLIDYQRRADGDRRWEDRVPVESNLFEAFGLVYPRLIADLEAPFRLEKGVRIDESPLAAALREALVNLLVHADYAERTPSVVIRTPDGCLFHNPGNSRVPIAELRQGIVSSPRNPLLFRMFRYVGLAEEAGTGLASIFRTWRENGYLPPYIDPRTERYEFTLLLPYIDFLPVEDQEWFRLLGGSFSEEEQIALLWAKRQGFVDNESLRGQTGQHSADVTKLLTSLRDRGLLEMHGSGRWAHYGLSRFAEETAATSGAESRRQLSLLDLAPAGSASGDTGSNRPDSRTIEVSSGTIDAPSSAISAKLYDISAPARESHRLPKRAAHALILDMCSVHPLTARDIAEYMGRSTRWVYTNVRELRDDNRLELTYPDRLTHPNQRYRTARMNDLH